MSFDQTYVFERKKSVSGPTFRKEELDLDWNDGLILVALRDIEEDLPPEQTEILYQDLELWRDILNRIMRAVEHRIIAFRAESISKGPRFRSSFEKWKAEALAFKQEVILRVQEVKAMIKDDNVEKTNVLDSERNTVWHAMLVELRAIRALLEKG